MKNKTRTKSINKKQVKAVKKKIPPSQKSLLSKKNEETGKNKLGLEDFTTLRKRSTKPRISGNVEKYWNILENIQDGCFEVDLPGNFTFLNDSVCRVLGYSREELMKMNVRQLSDKETLKKVFQATNEVYKTGKPIKEFGWQVTRKDGAERYIQGSISLRKDSSGNPIGFLVIANDITERKQTEDSLHLSEEKYRTILENIQEGYFEVDLAGNYTFLNDSICRIHGYPKKELMGMNNRQYTKKEVAKKVFKAFNGVYKTGKPLKHIDWQIIRKDGVERYIEASVSLRKDSLGKPIGFRGIIRDITKRKQAEEDIREGEEKYRTIIENMDDIYFEVDIKGNITFINPSSCKMSGYSEEELLGMPFKKISAPDGIEKVKQYFGKIFLTGKTGKPFLWNLVKKNGEQGFSELVASLIRDKQGKPIGFKGIGRDVTERKQAEKALRESEYRYKSLIENIPDIIFTIDMEGKITFASKRAKELLGYEDAETINMYFFNFIPEEDRQEAAEKMLKGMKGEKIKHIQTPIIAKSGEKLIFDCSFSRICKDGTVVGAQGTAVDITERKQAEEKMRESEKLYRAIFENTGTATLIISGDDFITLANTEFERLTGYTREEAENKKRWMEFIVKDDLKKMQKQRRIRMENEKDALRSYEFRLLTKTGEIKDILLFIDMIGSTKQTVCSLMDITERKKAEKAIKKSELKYRNIFENAIEGIYQSTTEGRFITANAALARMAGYDSPEEFIESIKDIGTQLYVNPEDRKRFLEIRDAKGFVEGFEVEFYKKDGSTFWVVINARTVKDEQGKIIYTEGLIEDITIRKHSEKLLHQTLDSLRKAVGTTVQVLVSALESRDPYTSGHQSRSADLACAIAKDMGLAQDKIEGVRMAGIIHDIGKLSIPAEILSKPSKLTNIEFSLIKEHSRSGYEMLKDVESPWPLAEIVYQHHERINGSGYPRNLKGDEILVESQILAVADVVEAMASHRPYRAALGIDAALAEIEKNKGILYDNTVANTCLKLFRNKGYQLI